MLDITAFILLFLSCVAVITIIITYLLISVDLICRDMKHIKKNKNNIFKIGDND